MALPFRDGRALSRPLHAQAGALRVCFRSGAGVCLKAQVQEIANEDRKRRGRTPEERITAVSIAVNAVLTGGKLAVGLWGKSAALIADATGKSLSSVYVYLRSIRNRSQDSRKKV